MKYLKVLLPLLFLLVMPAYAQNYSSVTAISITDASGVPLVSGTICFQPVNAQLQVSGFTAGGGGVVSTQPACRTVTNGVMVPLTLAASNYSSPLGAQYEVTLTDDIANQVMNLGYAYVTGANFDLDRGASRKSAR